MAKSEKSGKSGTKAETMTVPQPAGPETTRRENAEKGFKASATLTDRKSVV